MHRRSVLAALVTMPLAACRRSSQTGIRTSDGKLRLVLKYQPLGASRVFEELLQAFERLHPNVRVIAEALPNASDLAHQFFLTALEGGARDFDVFVVDVVWVAEFARAGFLLDLSRTIAPEVVRRDFLAGTAEAVIVEGKTRAVPWYADAGILFRRTDLVPDAPRTYTELCEAAERITRQRSDLRGFVWQGRQYEGLVCNTYEAIWGHAGKTLAGERVVLDSEPGRAALRYLRTLLERGISPASVTSAAEEEARRTFQAGQAVFMRNWPYAFSEAERAGSRIRGRVDISALPTLQGELGSGALGGYQLAVNANVYDEKRAAALALLQHLTSPDANLKLAMAYGRSPPRHAVYEDAELLRRAPLIAKLKPMLERAKPRPVTPYYSAISDTLQSEFSAAISGIRAPEQALSRAQKLVDHITGFA